MTKFASEEDLEQYVLQIEKCTRNLLISSTSVPFIVIVQQFLS